MASLRMAPLEAATWSQGPSFHKFTSDFIACWLLAGSWIWRRRGWSDGARNPSRHRHLTGSAGLDGPCDRGRERRPMSEQRKRARTAVQWVRGGPCGVLIRLSLHALLPLLDPSKGRPLSKGIGIGCSAARYRAARAGLLDGYLIGRWGAA